MQEQEQEQEPETSKARLPEAFFGPKAVFLP
jgi:hypothetical protein